MLLVDIGNTRVKWCSDGDPAVDAAVYQAADVGEAVESSWCKIRVPNRVAISCVGSKDVQDQITALALKLWGISPEFFVSEKECRGVTNGYQRPSQLGVDRWMAVIAAHNLFFPSAVVVVDAGSAVTIDAVSAGGLHMGGLIFPGLTMMRNSFFAKTANTPVAKDASFALRPFADTTDEAVSNGTLFSVIGAIQLAIGMIAAELESEEIAVVITGGDAELLLRWLDGGVVFEPNLVLRGVALVAELEQCD